MRDDRHTLPLRPCAGAVLVNAAGLVFAGRRAGVDDDATAWQFPQGGIDRGEDPQMAARRELWEETSVRSALLIGEHPGWLDYEVPDDLASGRFASKWRGQTQKWFAFRFTGMDDEIDVLHPGDGDPVEFSDWRWLRLEAMPSLVVPFKRPVYEALARDFARHAVPA